MIPAMYITARRFFSQYQALVAAGLVAVIPLFINYSVNGRGYTMLVLLALQGLSGVLLLVPGMAWYGALCLAALHASLRCDGAERAANEVAELLTARVAVP